KNYWADQNVYIEIWNEKDATTGSLYELLAEFGVVMRVGRGFQSSTRVREIGELFNRIAKPRIVVFYLGDFDSSGMDIERDLRARVEEHTFRTFEVRRVAIFADDIKKFNLPPQRVKSEDPRADSFRKAHGRQCVELDALQPVERRRRGTSRGSSSTVWSHRHEPAAEQGASRRSPAQSDGGWPNRHTPLSG